MRATITWLGNAGFTFILGQTRLLVDPFFSRPPAVRLFFGRVSPDPTTYWSQNCDAILISHAHFDHLMDAPGIALHCGARLYGSANACAIARACGVPEQQIQEIHAEEEIRVKTLRVLAISARHPWLPGFTAGKLPTNITPPLRLRDYRMDECFSFLIKGSPSVLVWSSTSTRGAQPADVLICRAVAETDWYRRLLAATRPKLVIPSHWDDMFRPLSEPPVPFFTLPQLDFPPIARINLENFREIVTHARPGTRVLLPERFQNYDMGYLCA